MTSASKPVTSSAMTWDLMKRFVADRSGATAIEYGLIASLIAVACIAAFTALGGNSSQGWQGVANKASAVMK